MCIIALVLPVAVSLVVGSAGASAPATWAADAARGVGAKQARRAASTNTPTATRTRTPTATHTPTATPTATPISIAVDLVNVPAGNGVAAFRIGLTEVTNAQYRECVNAGACSLPGTTTYYDNPSRAGHPVVHVTRSQAQAYAAWAGGRLPMAAEWTRACQGDDERMYPWGNWPPDDTRANYGWIRGDMIEVGSFLRGASPYGALDMLGNVWEWVDDGDYIIRGGAYHFTADSGVCSAQPTTGSDAGNRYVGFRIAAPGP